MRSSKPFTHLNDDQLLAYLDGEMSNARMRAVRNHLRTLLELPICARRNRGSG